MIEIKFIVLVICGVLKLIGELWWHNAQRWIMPAVLGMGVSLVSHIWWLGLLVYPCCIALDLGYKDYGPSNGFNRGCWLFVIMAVAGFACTWFHHLSIFFYIPWCIVGGIWGATTRNIWNIIIAPLTGFLIGSMVFFVH